ncbi:MAG TPA: hypothetical protein VGM62_06375 [Chthoniobacterales bacterium]|jgi:hypothetical protein
MKKQDRVQANTAPYVNREIERQTTRRLVRASGQTSATISRRINELEDEWDVERWLEMNASALAFSGVVLGILVNKKFFAIPCIVLPFLFQHAVQGWCPPIPILRRRGVRTRREIDSEKYALKALRGDFSQVKNNGDPQKAAHAAWQAANA